MGWNVRRAMSIGMHESYCDEPSSQLLGRQSCRSAVGAKLIHIKQRYAYLSRGRQDARASDVLMTARNNLPVQGMPQVQQYEHSGSKAPKGSRLFQFPNADAKAGELAAAEEAPAPVRTIRRTTLG